MKRIACVAAVVAMSVTETVLACSCRQPPPPLEALEQSDGVFHGTVVGIEPFAETRLAVSFDLHAVWKGDPTLLARITTPDNGAACGVYFEVGAEYLVYTYAFEGEHSAILCSRTAQFSADEAAELGAPIWTAGEATQMIRGDANDDGKVNIADAVAALSHLFLGGAVSCRKSVDVDDSGELDVTDPVLLLGYLFLGGVAPPAPFPACGEDPTVDPLGCADAAMCP